MATDIVVSVVAEIVGQIASMATKIVVSVVAEIVNELVGGAIHQVRYLFCFNNYVKDLETEKDTLQSKLKSVLDRSKEAKKRTEKIDDAVEQWLKDADCLIKKVVELEEKAEKRKKTSCLTHCPNWFRRYRLAKQLKEKTNEIKEHKKIKFPQFSRLETLIGMKYFSSQDFIPFDSRKSIYEELLEALQGDEDFMIGLYGMGGCGKTTLVKEVGKKAEQHFDKVVFVVVSNPINVRKIQGNIADQLNISLTEEEEPERARRLFMGLSKRERVLIILDDVWEKLDFEDIGIPIGENQKGCRALLTTRQRNVCNLMGCQRTFPLDLLSEEEARTLFKKHAGITDNNSDTLKSLAREITNECKGLPVAIAAVASTLKCKTQVEWKEALKTLKRSRPMDIEGGLKNPYTCLQLSYDYLKNEVAKSLFLLCSIFPEDCEIPVELLTIFGIGLGFVREVYSYNRARDQVSIAINKLLDSCLLLKDDEEDYVKMHDLVRDVAKWIAKKDNKLIMGTEISQMPLEEDGTIMDSTIRYLWCEGVEEFLQKLDCSKLEFLFLSVNSEQNVKVPNDLFEGMKEIRILVLENSRGNQPNLQLPKSIELLTNLRCLLLRGWKLGDVSFIAELKKLETLKLRYCSFHELPNGIIILKKLRLLDLSNCEIQRNPYEVIGSCLQLQELCFNENRCTEWEGEDGNVAEFYDKNKATPALQRYWIELGKGFHPFGRQRFSISRGVFVQYFDTCISNATIKDLMQRAEVISLGGICRCKSIFPDTVQTIGGMNELTKLSLHDSDHEVECLIDTTIHLCQVGIISNLTQLIITRMNGLKILCHGYPPRSLFEKLEMLRITRCNALKHIIVDEAEEIISDDNDATSYRFAFPKLKRLEIVDCKQLEYLFPVSFARSLTQLKTLDISNAVELKYIFGPSSHEDKIIELPVLERLSLDDMPNIISICPEDYYLLCPSLKDLSVACPRLNIMSINHCIGGSELKQEDQTAPEDQMGAITKCLQNLKSLNVINCSMDPIFHLEGLPMNGQQVTFGLQDLTLQDLPELRYIWMGPKHFLSLQNLRGLKIVKCGKLKVIFSTSILRSLPQLKTLVITNCKELEKIIEDNEENQSLSNPQVLFLPQLTTLIVKDCHKLKSLFSISTSHDLPKLRELVIIEASELEEVFGHEQNERKEGAENVLPNLESLILMQLPRLAAVCHWIDLQSVRYCFVQQSPNLSLTSTITLEDLQQKYEEDAASQWVDDGYTVLHEIIKSNKDSTKETTNEILSKESEVQGASKSELPSSQANVNQSMPHNLPQNNQNDCGIQSDNEQELEQKLSPIASPNLTQSFKETKKGTVGNVSALEIPAMAASTNFELISVQVPSPLAIPLHKTPSSVTELVDERPISGPSLTNQQQPLSKTEITIEIPHGINSMTKIEDQRVQEGPKSEKAVAATVSTNLEPRNPSPRPLVIPLQKGVKGSDEECSTSTHSELASSLPGPLVTSLHKKSPHSNQGQQNRDRH